MRRGSKDIGEETNLVMREFLDSETMDRFRLLSRSAKTSEKAKGIEED